MINKDQKWDFDTEKDGIRRRHGRGFYSVSSVYSVGPWKGLLCENLFSNTLNV